MPTVSLRVSEEELEAWRALAGPRRLSEWLRSLANDAAETPEAARSPGMASGSGGLQSVLGPESPSYDEMGQ